MLKFIITLAVSIWLTSSLFMLWFWANAFIATRREGKIFLLPIGHFLYIHFCPIVHTIKCFQILRRYAELKDAQKRGV